MLQILESEEFIFSGANLWCIVRLDDRAYGCGLMPELTSVTQIAMICIIHMKTEARHLSKSKPSSGALCK
jgi:hypothetical protein